MKQKLYRLEPVFEERLWGTQRLREKYGYETDLDNIAEVYNVCAMPGHLDNVVSGTGLFLSEFYREHRELFGCDTEEMPVEVCMAHSNSYLSVQVHPDDAYAFLHEGSRGRPEGGVVIEADGDCRVVLGHHAKTREEFKELAEKGEWDRLLRYIETKPDQYTQTPAWTLHAFCPNALVVAFSTNADITYRLYDYERLDPKTGRLRQLHTQQVIDHVTVPDDTIQAFYPEVRREQGCEICQYHDEPGAFTCGRIKVSGTGRYETDDFMFYVCVDGAGTINRVPVKGGETLFAPKGFGVAVFEGELDLMYVTYRNK